MQSTVIRNALSLLSCLLPWRLRRRLLVSLFGFELHPSSRIGLSWVLPRELSMGEGATIGHLNMIRGLDRLELSEYAHIGRYNWIYGVSASDQTAFRFGRPRASELIMGKGSGIVKRHLIDCTNRVVVDEYALIAGSRSLLLTHSVDLEKGIQDSAPIHIGAYSFVGASCTILGGAALPQESVLGAMSLLNRPLTDRLKLYGGVPARPLKTLDGNDAWFAHRRHDGVME
jgi:serine acetyltransferase